MLTRVTVFSLLSLALSYSPALWAGQAITVFSGGADARNCYLAAKTAANRMFTSREDLETCDRALDSGLLKHRDRAGTLVNRAIVETTLSRYKDAFADYHSAMVIIPDLPEAYVGRGNIYFLANKLDRAIEDYSRALELNISRSYITYLNRGMAYEKLGRYDVAEADYRQALAAQPDWELAIKKLNRVLAKQAVKKQ
jgi:tetratricopeptide (TPR) repeat protein